MFIVAHFQVFIDFFGRDAFLEVFIDFFGRSLRLTMAKRFLRNG